MARLTLLADCDRCEALCCVAPAFDRGEDFALTKAAGEPCPNLRADGRCAIHAERLHRGFGGCVAYDCHGAGQRASRAYASAPVAQRHQAFLVLRQIHELAWLLDGALRLCAGHDAPVVAELKTKLAELEALPLDDLDAALALDVEPHARTTRALLRRIAGELPQLRR